MEISEFIYAGVQLRYNPETGECWKQWNNGKWALITAGNKGKYAQLWVGAKQVSLHRVIAEVFLNGNKPLTAQQEVDHIKHADGSHAQDKLSNLRIVSHGQNSKNQRIACNNKSGYKGVSWEKNANQWRAQIMSQGRRKYLGLFSTPEAAALTYDKAAKELHGEFAKLNFN